MDYVIIDVREPAEFNSGHINGAINIPPAELMSGTAKLDRIAKDAPIILYCISGSRSNVSINIMRGLGYTNLTNGINKQQVESKYGL